MIPSVLATPVYEMVLGARRGLGRLGAEAINESASRMVVVAVGIPVVLMGGSLRAAVSAYAVADLLSALVIWQRATRAWDGGWEWKWFFDKQLAAAAK